MKVFAFFILTSIFFAPAALGQKEEVPKSIAGSAGLALGWAEKGFLGVAEAMPEEKYSYIPTQGNFEGVRSFGEQVKHVACANEAWAKKLRGEKPPDRCDLGGSNPAKTKTEILAYLQETFVMVDGEIAKTKLDNLMSPVQGPYAGDNRLEVLNSALWHISDHYGQLVEYLRMNGIVPQASR